MGKILCRNQAGEYISSTAWILQRFCQTENLVLFIFKFTFWKKQTKRFKNKHKKKHPHKFWKNFSISSKIRPEIRFFRFKNDHFGTRSPKWPKFGPKKWISSSRSTLISILMAKSDSTQNFDRGKCYLLGMSPYINDTRALQSFFKSTFSKNHHHSGSAWLPYERKPVEGSNFQGSSAKAASFDISIPFSNKGISSRSKWAYKVLK